MYSETVRKLALYVREIQEMGLYRIMADPKMFASFSGTALYFIMLPMIAILLTINAVINGIQLVQARNKNIDKWLQFIMSSLGAIATSVSLYGGVIATALGVTFAAGPWFFLSGIALGLINQLFFLGLNIARAVDSPPNSIERMHHLQAALNNAYVSLLLAVIIGVITFVLLSPVLPLAGTICAFAAAGLIAAGFLWRLCPHRWKIGIKNALHLGKPDIEKQYLSDKAEQKNSVEADAVKAEHFSKLFVRPDYSEQIRTMKLDKAIQHMKRVIANKMNTLEESPNSNKTQQKLHLLRDLKTSFTYSTTVDKQDLAQKYPLAFQSFWVEKGDVEQITDAVVELEKAMREREPVKNDEMVIML